MNDLKEIDELSSFLFREMKEFSIPSFYLANRLHEKGYRKFEYSIKHFAETLKNNMDVYGNELDGYSIVDRTVNEFLEEYLGGDNDEVD